MPKGALLHAHLDATVNTAVLLKIALKQPAMHVSVKTRLTAESLAVTLPQFGAQPPQDHLERNSITEESYGSDEWVHIAKARANFAPELGGPEGFDKWIIGAISINPQEAYETYNTHDLVIEKSESYIWVYYS